NHTMSAPEDYGKFIEMRTRGPSAAARVGAVAMLLRSLATGSLRSPHTGMTSYDPDAPRIPGAAISTEDADLLHRLLRRRTVRVVLFMNEENGLAGGKGYAAAHQGELGRHVAALEADSGAGPPLAVRLRSGDGGSSMLAPWLAPLASLGIELREGDASGADLSPLDSSGVPLVAV